MDTLEKEICYRIRELRRKLKLTQSQFAVMVGLSEDCVGKIERGVSVPSLLTVYKITGALKIPVEALIIPKAGHEAGPPHGEAGSALRDLTSYLRSRPPEDVVLLHELAVKIFDHKKRKF